MLSPRPRRPLSAPGPDLLPLRPLGGNLGGGGVFARHPAAISAPAARSWRAWVCPSLLRSLRPAPFAKRHILRIIAHSPFGHPCAIPLGSASLCAKCLPFANNLRVLPPGLQVKGMAARPSTPRQAGRLPSPALPDGHKVKGSNCRFALKGWDGYGRPSPKSTIRPAAALSRGQGPISPAPPGSGRPRPLTLRSRAQ